MGDFTFKQFHIRQAHTAMKVSTDGVLLGAWATVSGLRILDVGSGTGLLALMAAQRNAAAHVTAVEIDNDAAGDCAENFAASAWAERLTLVQADFLQMRFEKPFDAVIANPPYFQASLTAPNAGRTAARHADGTLPLGDFAQKTAECIAADGTVSVIYPPDVAERFVREMGSYGFGVARRCAVYSKENAAQPKRMLIALRRGARDVQAERLDILTATGERTSAYRALTEAFYL